VGSPDAEVDIDATLVGSLLAEQHADLAVLGLTALDAGWDNSLWRLGDRLVVRLQCVGRLHHVGDRHSGNFGKGKLPIEVTQRLGEGLRCRTERTVGRRHRVGRPRHRAIMSVAKPPSSTTNESIPNASVSLLRFIAHTSMAAFVAPYTDPSAPVIGGRRINDDSVMNRRRRRSRNRTNSC
jgi:hypothetical protein